MAKKSSVNIPTIVIIRIIVFLFIGFVIFGIYSRTQRFLTHAPIFGIKEVLVDKSISFIDHRPLKDLVGQNIFTADLKRIHRNIASKYPQISQLSVVRQLPDTVKVLAKKREILLQVVVTGNKFLVVDTEGVTMFYTNAPLPFPLAKGIPLDRTKIILGGPSTIKELNLVVDLLKELKSHPNTSKLRIISVDATNLSKVKLHVKPNIYIIIDQEAFSAKVSMLEILFQNGKVNWSRVKYIDVRFKEPIINETNPEEDK
jgi:cell division septal protein FtsQ